MLIMEFRVILPMTVKEYQCAQLFSVAEASKNETGGGDGIEVKENRAYDQSQNTADVTYPIFHADGQSFDAGQFTNKVYHLEKKVPRFVSFFAPKGSLKMIETAYNAYPYCKTSISNKYMANKFSLDIITYHKADRGEVDNIHNLNAKQLDKRVVVYIDIANDVVSNSDYKKEEDPTLFRSEKTGRGPLHGNWTQTVQPVMCAYKLVICEFIWLTLQNRVEKFIMDTEKRLFTNFHRLLFCSMDRWYGLTMEDIRAIEDKTKKDLEELIKKPEIRGIVVHDEKGDNKKA